MLQYMGSQRVGHDRATKLNWTGSYHHHCYNKKGGIFEFAVVVQWLSHVWLFATLWTSPSCTMPGFPVLHYLPELAQTHAHWVSDAIQPSHPLSSPSPAFNLSQYQSEPRAAYLGQKSLEKKASRRTHILILNNCWMLDMGYWEWEMAGISVLYTPIFCGFYIHEAHLLFMVKKWKKKEKVPSWFWLREEE